MGAKRVGHLRPSTASTDPATLSMGVREVLSESMEEAPRRQSRLKYIWGKNQLPPLRKRHSFLPRLRQPQAGGGEGGSCDVYEVAVIDFCPKYISIGTGDGAPPPCFPKEPLELPYLV